VKDLGWSLTVPEWERPHVTTKSGPNAQALVGSIEDAHLLTEKQIDNLRICGGNELVRTIGVIRSLSDPTWCELVKINPKGILSRLSYIKDKEAKCRIVAILDYWTQSCSEPLHKAPLRFCGASNRIAPLIKVASEPNYHLEGRITLVI
jgi:hypothetical protein